MSVAEELAPRTRLLVRAGVRSFVLELDRVDGVALTPPMTRVPGTPAALRGLVNHQGTILPAIDPAADQPGERRHLVLIESRRYGRFALLCDWVEDLAASDTDAEQLDPDELAATVVDAYEGLEQRVPEAETPTARIMLRPIARED